MINLLPVVYKKVVKREFLRRYIVVCGFGFFLLVLAQLTLISVLFFLTDSYENSFGDVLLSVQKYAESRNLEDLEAETIELNSFLTMFLSGEKSDKKNIISTSIYKIIENKPNLVKLTSLAFDSRERVDGSLQVSLAGNARTRNSLLLS